MLLFVSVLENITHIYLYSNKMKKIFAMLCMCTVLAATMSAGSVLRAGQTSVLGTRFCMLHVYDWQDNASGVMSVSQGDPYYDGGWSVSIVQGESAGRVLVEGGMTPHGVSQPMLVSNNVVTLEAGDEPFATVSNSVTTSAGGMTTVVDSVTLYYLVNEAWLVDGAPMSNVQGEVLADGSIHIADGFAYYIETTVTTTIMDKDGHSRTYTDETVAMSPIYRDTWLMAPNGKHEFVNQADGTTNVVDVYIRQSGDTVWVTNLYGYGAPEVFMVLATDGTMSYPSQLVRDIPNSMSPNGSGVWTNSAVTGAATADAITWGLTQPGDGVQTWAGWRDNRLYFTNGTHFIIPGDVPPGLLGDVNNDGEVNISDVTTLISHVLNGDFTEGETFNPANADCNQDGSWTIADVTLLISRVLRGYWSS